MFISTTIEKDRNRRSGISFKLSNCNHHGWDPAVLEFVVVVLRLFFLLNVIQTFCGCWMNPPNTLGRISFPTPLHPLHRIGSKKSSKGGGSRLWSWSWVVRGKSCSSRARREYQSIETQVVVLQRKRKENGGTSRPPPPPHIKGQATRVQSSPDSWETDVRSTSFSNDNSPERRKKMRNKRDFGDSSRKELEKELRHHAGITDSGSCYYYYYYYYYYQQ